MAKVRKQVDLIAKPLFKERGFNKKGEDFRNEDDSKYIYFVYHYYQYGDPWVSMLYFFGFKKLDKLVYEIFGEGNGSTACFSQNMDNMVKDGLCAENHFVCTEDTLKGDVLKMYDLFFEKIYPEWNKINNYNDYYNFLKSRLDSILRDRKYPAMVALFLIAKSKGSTEYQHMKSLIVEKITLNNIRLKEIINVIDQKFDGKLEE